MARAKRHYVPDQIWHITQRCHKLRSFTSAHWKWVQAALENIDAMRESRWTESIAVGSSPFIERIKHAMGAMAKGRSIQPTEGSFELREAPSAYNSILDPNNRDIGPKKAFYSNLYTLI